MDLEIRDKTGIDLHERNLARSTYRNGYRQHLGYQSRLGAAGDPAGMRRQLFS